MIDAPRDPVALAACLRTMSELLQVEASKLAAQPRRSISFTSLSPAEGAAIAGWWLEGFAGLVGVADMPEFVTRLPVARFAHSKIRIAGVECQVLIGEGGQRGIAPDEWLQVAQAIVSGRWDGDAWRLSAFGWMTRSVETAG